MRIPTSCFRFLGLVSLIAALLLISASMATPNNKRLTADAAHAEQGCPDNAPVDCGSYCCPSGYSCCGGGCCPSDTPHYCARSHKCYKYATDAQKDCGSSYSVCGRPSG